MTHEQAVDLLKTLHDIRSGIGWACLWLFLILILK